MVSVLVEEEVFEDIMDKCVALFGFELISFEPIHRGWLNLKWKIETTDGTFLVKQYNAGRLKKYSVREMKNVFQLQNYLHSRGFPCPKILNHNNNSFFQSKGEESFIVMEYCYGKTIQAGKLTDSQMFDLGYYTGKMHYLLNRDFPQTTRVPAFQTPAAEERYHYWQSLIKDVAAQGKFHLQPIMEQQLNLLQKINPDNFIQPQTGWTHRDLWVDNLLFKPHELTAIIDFDRMKHDYLALDVGRAVISGVLDGNQFDSKRALALLEGYRHYQQVGPGFLTNSLKLLWYMESEWWLDTDLDERKGPPKRFVQEMIWLSEHLLELDEILEFN